MQVINYLQYKDIPRTDLGKIIEDILLLAESFRSVSWSYVQRENNSLAHNLAKAVNVSNNGLWMHSYPEEVARFVFKDKYGSI